MEHLKGYLFFTARKRSFGQGNIFAPVCHSVHSGGCLLLGGVPASGGGACSQGGPAAGGVPAPGGAPGPHPRGKLRGIRSRPTAKGEIEGDQVQVHTQGGN